MSGPDAMHSEMPGFSFPGRPGGEHDEPLLDMIIARRALPPDAPQEMHDLARMLAALAGPGEPGELAPGELAGEAAALAAFVRLASPAGISPAARRPVRRHRRSRRPRRRASSWAGLAAAMVAAAAMLSVLAAYAGVLPTPVQQLAARRGRGATPPSRRPGAVPGGAIIADRSRSRSGRRVPASRTRGRTSRPARSRGPASRDRPGHGRRRRRRPFTAPPARPACRARVHPSSPGRGCPADSGSSYLVAAGNAAAPVPSARPGPCPPWSPRSLDPDNSAVRRSGAPDIWR